MTRDVLAYYQLTLQHYRKGPGDHTNQSLSDPSSVSHYGSTPGDRKLLEGRIRPFSQARGIQIFGRVFGLFSDDWSVVGLHVMLGMLRLLII